MITVENIVKQLVDIYYREENWHSFKMESLEAIEYHRILLDKGRIIFYMLDDTVLGYCESWRIDYAQLGRLLCKQSFDASKEDVQNGSICYVANVWIDKEYRGEWQNAPIIKAMTYEFFKDNFDADFFCGEAFRKKHQPFKIYKRTDFIEKYLKGRNDG